MQQVLATSTWLEVSLDLSELWFLGQDLASSIRPPLRNWSKKPIWRKERSAILRILKMINTRKDKAVMRNTNIDKPKGQRIQALSQATSLHIRWSRASPMTKSRRSEIVGRFGKVQWTFMILRMTCQLRCAFIFSVSSSKSFQLYNRISASSSFRFTTKILTNHTSWTHHSLLLLAPCFCMLDGWCLMLLRCFRSNTSRGWAMTTSLAISSHLSTLLWFQYCRPVYLRLSLIHCSTNSERRRVIRT